MITDMYGQIVMTEQDICDLYMKNPDAEVRKFVSDSEIVISPDLELINPPTIIAQTLDAMSIEEFDNIHSNLWHMPEAYKTFDVAAFVLDRCTTDEELQRAGHELLEFEARDMFMLLRYLKYMVDLMRQHDIVWGVGRGSSVSSFVLFLLEVHRINPLYYDLPFEDFVR